MLACIAATGAALFVTSPTQAAAIAVANGDFEANAGLANGGYRPGHVLPTTGWAQSGGSGTGLWNPTAADFGDEAAHGHVGFASGNGELTQVSAGTLAQLVPNYVLQAHTRYTLTLDVGRHFQAATWNYAVGLIAGFGSGTPLLLASLKGDTDHLGQSFQLGSFRTVKLSFETGAKGPALKQPLSIALSSSKSGASFDNVRLDATSINAVPEPQSWAMMIAGFGLVGGAMRRRYSASAVVAA